MAERDSVQVTGFYGERLTKVLRRTVDDIADIGNLVVWSVQANDKSATVVSEISGALAALETSLSSVREKLDQTRQSDGRE